MTLYSLDANYYPGSESAAKITPETVFFHDWPVLGKKVITDASERHSLWNALNKGIQENEGIAASCFWPRHGISVHQAGVQTDYVICFKCLQLAIHTGDKEEFALTSSYAQPLFNRVLEAAGIPIAPGGS